MNYQIKNRYTSAVIHEAEGESLKEVVKKAVKENGYSSIETASYHAFMKLAQAHFKTRKAKK